MAVVKEKKDEKEGETVEEKKTKGSGLDPKVAGALSYLFGILTGIIFLLIDKEDEYVRFHALQSIMTNIVVIAVAFVLFITVVGIVCMPLLWLGTPITYLYLMYMAYTGQKYKLPYIGDYAEKYAKEMK
ncbi:MAG: DUF4870 domain-containing protein [Candidatus Micrarchaeia archaeon]